MDTIEKKQLILENENLVEILENFLLVKKTENRSPATIRYYNFEVSAFINWLAKKYKTKTITDITPNLLREHLDDIRATRNEGGVHARYRAIRAFLKFYDFEFEPDHFKNPIDKVKVKTPKLKPLKDVGNENLKKLISVCQGDSLAKRDKAIFICLASSGCRATEFLDLNVGDVDLIKSEVLIRHGKGRKMRIVFFSRPGIRALRAYLKTRTNLFVDSPVWATVGGVTRLSYGGLRSMVGRRAEGAKIAPPKLHSLRRYFAIESYRAGIPIMLISQLLGHENSEVTKRYLRFTNEDLRKEYSKLDIFR
jgi:site-specific recombinase XerD